MKELTNKECLSIMGGDPFLYDVFYLAGMVFQSSLESGKKARRTPGTNSYMITLKMGGL
ncbi:hypothetical protein [Cyclobacterium sp. SYSU L10401]|uniref:hypothetical protein n=1 Tax=Cyclobacterium sp. SYSU L10401 TaxID=2678657 RepID=UPI0013D533A9|nr:hypothetical protein [Cyclobacterium sp. SYSU L10401]